MELIFKEQEFSNFSGCRRTLTVPVQFNSASDSQICDDTYCLSYFEFNQLIRDYHKVYSEAACSGVMLLNVVQSVHSLAAILACFGLDKTVVFCASTSDIPAVLSSCDHFELDDQQRLLHANKASNHESIKINDQVLESNGLLGFLSSGSVGESKVILHRFASLIANSESALSLLPLSERDKVLIPVPISHMYGFGAAALSSLCAGASIQLTKGLNLLKWKQIERTWRPSSVFFTPSLLDAVSAKLSDKHSLKLIVTAGDCVNTRYLDAWSNKTQYWLNLYGSTEMGVVGIAPLINQGARQQDASHAQFTPCPGVHVTSNNEQLYIHQVHAFVGYLNSAMRCSKVPLSVQHINVTELPFKTGDLGAVANDGRFSVYGRTKFSVNREGRLLAFAQLEIELKKHALKEGSPIGDLVLIPGPQDSRGKTLIACCEGITDNQLGALRQIWREHLPVYTIPSQVTLVDPLPRLANGKPNRRKLEEAISHV
jgi:acyl-coenzyme A synthetase/AMP-(fatty) acid ligase